MQVIVAGRCTGKTTYANMLLTQKGDKCLHLSPFSHMEHNKWTYEQFNSACIGLNDNQRGRTEPVGLNRYKYVIMEEPALSNSTFNKSLYLIPNHLEIILIIGGLVDPRDKFSSIVNSVNGVIRWSHVHTPEYITSTYRPDIVSIDWKAEFLEEI